MLQFNLSQWTIDEMTHLDLIHLVMNYLLMSTVYSISAWWRLPLINYGWVLVGQWVGCWFFVVMFKHVSWLMNLITLCWVASWHLLVLLFAWDTISMWRIARDNICGSICNLLLSGLNWSFWLFNTLLIALPWVLAYLRYFEWWNSSFPTVIEIDELQIQVPVPHLSQHLVFHQLHYPIKS